VLARASMDDADFAASFGPAAAPPGHHLRVVLEQQHLSQAQLAARTGLSTKHINQLVQGNASLSPDISLLLERATGEPSQLWNALEAKYQDAQAREKARTRLAEHTGWLKQFPLKDLESLGVLDVKAAPSVRVGQLLAFFQVADPNAYEQVWSQPIASGFRRTDAYKVNPYATATWLRLAELDASDLVLPVYDSAAFGRLLPELRSLTLLHEPKLVIEALRDRCRGVGVAVSCVAPVKGSTACGAARWPRSRNPMIVLSDRGKSADIFWFSFFHEAAHVLLHPKREMYIHRDARPDDADGLEGEADRAAVRMLIGQKVASRVRPGLTHAQVRTLSEEAGVDPGIIAGQVAHLTKDYVKYAKLRQPFAIEPLTSG
jgi:HTH-type transcriptional regulator/antitoxin HigA